MLTSLSTLMKCSSCSTGNLSGISLLKTTDCFSQFRSVRNPHDIPHFRSFKWRAPRDSAVHRYNTYSVAKRIATGKRGVEILLKKISKGEKFIAQYMGVRWKKEIYTPLLRFRPEGGEVSSEWKPMRTNSEYIRFRPDPFNDPSTKKTPHGYYYDYSGVGKRQKKMPPVEINKYITAVDPQYPYKASKAR